VADGTAAIREVGMKFSFKTAAGVAAVAATFAGLGLAAGTVVSSDGSVEVGDRLTGDYGPPETVRLEVPATRTTAEASGKKRRKPVVIHGFGNNRTVAGGGTDSISLLCPKKFPVPLSAGLSTEAPGVFPGIIERDVDEPGMFVAVVNVTNADIDWRPTAVCAKGMKEG
jgi:hypothetical protein